MSFAKDVATLLAESKTETGTPANVANPAKVGTTPDQTLAGLAGLAAPRVQNNEIEVPSKYLIVRAALDLWPGAWIVAIRDLPHKSASEAIR